MKSYRPILLLSVAANAVLLGLRFAAPAAPTAPASSGAPAAASMASRGARASAPAGPVAGSASRAGDATAGDLSALVAEMRHAGMPPGVVRAIVNAEMALQYADRRATVYGSLAEVPPFWAVDGSASGFLTDPARREAYFALINDRTDAMRQLLGDAFLPRTDEALANLRLQYGDLPPEKLFQLRTVSAEYARRQQEARTQMLLGGGGTMDADGQVRLAQIQAERHAALIALLSPEEALEMELRSSPTANQLRNQLAAFNASEEEFRAIFRAMHDFNGRYGGNTGGPLTITAETRQLRTEHQAELQQGIAAALTPERFAEYELITAPGNQQLARLLGRLELPLSTVTGITTLRTETQARANALRTDRTLNLDARNRQLAALQEETNAKAANLLGGQRGLDAYRQGGGGQWLQTIVPPAAIVRP